MPAVVLGEEAGARLRALARTHDGVPEALRRALDEAVYPRMDGASSAVPADAVVRIPHATLVAVAAYARANDRSGADWHLDTLLRGASIYTPPLPRYVRPKELDESLARIALMHEQKAYAAMTQRTSYEERIAPPATSAAAERQAWRESREQVGAVVNVLLSVGAVATAAWWAMGHVSPIWVRRTTYTESVYFAGDGAAHRHGRGRVVCAALARSDTPPRRSAAQATGRPARSAPAARRAAKIRSAISSTPVPCLTLANTVGPWSRILSASRRITSSDAPTCSARSILLITSRSDCEIPGPPLRGTLSPPDTSIT